MNEFYGNNYGIADAMDAQKRMANQLAGGRAYMDAMATQTNPDLARLGIVNMKAPSNSDTSSEPDMGLNAGFGRYSLRTK